LKRPDLFERPDWALFRSLSTPCQKAGVEKRQLPGLLIKELVDNALDAAGEQCSFGLISEQNGFWVEDRGPGLEGGPEKIGKLIPPIDILRDTLGKKSVQLFRKAIEGPWFGKPILMLRWLARYESPCLILKRR
jgi:hypothetical protein